MRLILSLVVFAVILHSGLPWEHSLFVGIPVTSKVPPDGQWFLQILDQYSPTDNRTWRQRYFTNSEFYKEGGPVFLMLGGEEPADGKWLRAGEMIELAKEYGALCFLLEHRFYGESHPLPDTSVKNLEYLNAELALADAAIFIECMQETLMLPEKTKWITFGCSYSGSLSAWMRLKYPHLVHGAVSSSGPLLAKLDFQEYLVLVERSLKRHSQQCVDTIADAIKEIGILLQHRNGQKELETLFKLCDPINSKNITKIDIKNFYVSIIYMFATIVQGNLVNNKESLISIDMACDVLVNEKKGVPLNRLADVSQMMLTKDGKVCFDYKYNKKILDLRNTTFGNPKKGVEFRQWMYQTCTEFGFYATFTAGTIFFNEALNIDYFIQQCVDIFGPRFLHSAKLGVKRANMLHGGLDIVNHVKNVVFVHGSIDPWRALGVIKSDNPDAPAIYINGTAHCANFYPPSSNDLPQLTQARKQISALISKWLQ